MEIKPHNPRRCCKVIASELNELLLPFHARRLERLGVDHSGLFNFYRQRLECGQLIGDREARIAATIDRELQRFDCYHVLRAGLGELALLLAELGHASIAYDPDRYRVQAIAASIALLQRERGWSDDRLVVHLDVIPVPTPQIRTLCIAIHALFGFESEEDEAIPIRFAPYDAVLFEPRTLCRMRENEREQDRLVAAFRDNGFPEIVPFPVLGLAFAAKRSAD